MHVVAMPHPFAVLAVHEDIPAGNTLAEIVLRVCGARVVGRRAIVTIDGDEIERKIWHRVRPKPGHLVTIRVVPGMGGGGGKKNPLGIVLALVTIAASFILGPVIGGLLATWTGIAADAAFLGIQGLTWGSVFNAIGSGIITLAGGLLSSAIAPPPSAAIAARSGQLAIEATSPTLSITGTSNRANPYGAVPRVLGTHRMFPPLGAIQYTEIVGDDQYFRALFDLGYGPLQLSDHRIGNTPLAQFEGVEIEIRQGYSTDAPITLYSNDLEEDPQSIKLAYGVRQVLETRDETDEITGDLGFQGLVHFDQEGNRQAASVTLRLEYRRAGSGDPWMLAPDTGTVQTSTAATLIATSGTPGVPGYTQDWRTDSAVGGPVSVTVRTRLTHEAEVTYGSGDQTVAVRETVVDGNAAFALYARTQGATDWVFQGAIGGDQDYFTWQVAAAIGAKAELRVVLTDTYLAGNGGAGPAFSYPALVAGDIVVTRATEQIVRVPFRIRPGSADRWEVSLTRLTADNTDAQTRDECFWTMLRSIHYRAPVNVTGHCLVALRIKASNQLSGLIQQYNVIASALLPVWDGLAWSAPQATSNPAWLALEVFRGAANKRPLADARIDLETWRAFAARNDRADQNGEPYYACDVVLDSRSTVMETVNQILATARAACIIKDGKYAVIWDDPQTVPVQMFTPRNSWGFKGSKIFPDRPHALRVRFVNPDKDWQQDEVTVYDDGYSVTNATKFEVVDAFGSTRQSQSWRLGRRMQAESKLRPEIYEISADIEHIVCRRGQLIRVAHDVPRWGVAWGRIKSVTLGGGSTITALVVDELATLSPGKTYAVRVRNARNEQSLATIQAVSVVTETTTLTLVNALAAGAAAAGDLVAWGEAGKETIEGIVKSIRRIGDMNARIEFVDAAPGIHNSDTGALPDFDLQQTFGGPSIDRAPPRPMVVDVRSDEDAMTELPGGGWQAAIRLTLQSSSGPAVAVDKTEVQLRRRDAGDAWEVQRFDGLPPVVYVTGIDEGTAYDLRVRAVAASGAASDWWLVDNHTVVGRATPPPAYTRVLVEDGQLVADYPSPPRDFLGARVEYHRGIQRVRAGAASAHPGSPTVPLPFNMSALPAGTLTIFLVAVDTSGNESTPTIVVRDVDGPGTDNIVDPLDLAAVGFPGTITGGAVASGVLQAAEESTNLYLPAGDAAYLPDSAALYLPTTWQEMTWQATFVPDAIDVPSTILVAATVAGQGWRLEYRGDDGTLYLPNAGDSYLPDAAGLYLGGPPAWAPMPPTLDARRIRYDLRVTVFAGAVRGQVSAFVVQFDVPDEEEWINNLVVPAGGVRLPLSRVYREIRFVGRTLQVDGNGAIDVVKVDYDPTLGPLVKGVNSAGASVQALCDFHVQGIKGIAA